MFTKLIIDGQERFRSPTGVITDVSGVVDLRCPTFISPDARIGQGVRIERNAVIYEGCEIGDNSIIGAGAVLRPYTIIGNNTIFGTLSVSEGRNKIGDRCTIHAQCHITQGVTIGNDCFIAPFFIATNTQKITPGPHGTARATEFKLLPTVIEDRVRIGTRVSMVPSCKIGHDSVIDMECLITKDVPPNSHIRGGKDKVGRPC